MLMAKLKITALHLMIATFFGFRWMGLSNNSLPIHFKNSRELSEFATSNGLVIHCGNERGVINDNYYIADHPLTLDELGPVSRRRDCGLTPAWRGILWVCQLHGPLMSLDPEVLGGKWRIWGNVVVAGDENLMDRIESLYRDK